MRAFVAVPAVAVSLLILASYPAGRWTTLHAAGDPDSPQLSVRITSPLGRTGVAGTVRIVAQVRPAAIDVSSGVESAPGIKDPNRLRSFFEALHD